MEFEAAATLQPRPLVDPFARAITYLRVSVTDRCDFRCVYCMAENMAFLPKADLLTLEELDRLSSAFIARGVRKLRLTGGEPLVRRGIMTLFATLSRHLSSGRLDELTLTTNGSQLAKYADELAGHGVKRINVSLDTLDADKFREITRWGDLDKVLDADMFVCVPITDYEVGQATLRHIKEHSRATVVLDAHGPTVTLTRSGERHPRVWADRDVWLPYIDILKMNLEEASSTWLGESAEVAAHPPTLSDEELHGLARHCLDRGVGSVCVTLDERGCVAFYRDGSSGVAEQFVDRIEVAHVVDTTGAGDPFAAGLADGYLAYRDYVVACQYGNAMGAQRCTGAELDVYLSREQTERQILAAYGPRPS